jgi:hypothetical protein
MIKEGGKTCSVCSKVYLDTYNSLDFNQYIYDGYPYHCDFCEKDFCSVECIQLEDVDLKLGSGIYWCLFCKAERQ